MNSINKIKNELKKLTDSEQAKLLQRFFKTGQGQYGEGDIFLGIKVPAQRELAKKYQDTPLSDLTMLLQSKIHEHRLVALLIAVQQFSKGDAKKKNEIFKFFINNSKQINNWDLVDVTVPKTVGYYLLDHPKEIKILYEFARSKNLWQRRIAIIATFPLIKNKNFDNTFKISKILLSDPHDLIHKAVGWMLREVGKINQPEEEKFLQQYYKIMPRTMLRYAIEKFPEKKRLGYLKN
jgi:3-methyladenine DNA glycosylase AlkD